MIKSMYDRFKRGVLIAADSFAMLIAHPVLFSYYAILLVAYCVTFIIAYNIIGYHSAILPLANEFQIPNQNLMNDLIPHIGGLMYIGLLLAVFFNIFFRNYFDVALIKHVYNIHKGEPASIQTSLAYAKGKLPLILSWTVLITGITLIANTISLLAFDPWITFFILSPISFAWSMITFFMLPIITLEHKTVLTGLQASAQYMAKTFKEVCGGILWIMLMYAIAIVTLALLETLLPLPYGILVGIFIVNAILSSVISIFKTKIYTLYQTREHRSDDHAQADYTQF